MNKRNLVNVAKLIVTIAATAGPVLIGMADAPIEPPLVVPATGELEFTGTNGFALSPNVRAFPLDPAQGNAFAFSAWVNADADTKVRAV